VKERCFEPSQYHLHLLGKLEREFAWRGADFAAWQRGLRERFVGMIGAFSDCPVPLEVEELEREETEEYVRLGLVFASEECADVPAHLLIPGGREPPLPAMICLQGHSPGMHISLGRASDEREAAMIRGDRDIAVQAVRRGFVVLAIEQRCFGRREEHRNRARRHRCDDAVLRSLMLGKTILGERVWDVMRGVDLLRGRPEVDPGRIGCMGNSGGGKVSFYAACVDERIGLAVASCTFCTYADSNMRLGGCADNYIPGILRVAEMGELAGLVAPRRLLIVAGRDDELFPLAGVRRGYETAREIFAAAGCAENVRLIVGPEGHRFYAELAWPAIMDMMP